MPPSRIFDHQGVEVHDRPPWLERARLRFAPRQAPPRSRSSRLGAMSAFVLLGDVRLDVAHAHAPRTGRGSCRRSRRSVVGASSPAAARRSFDRAARRCPPAQARSEASWRRCRRVNCPSRALRRRARRTGWSVSSASSARSTRAPVSCCEQPLRPLIRSSGLQPSTPRANSSSSSRRIFLSFFIGVPSPSCRGRPTQAHRRSYGISNRLNLAAGGPHPLRPFTAARLSA